MKLIGWLICKATGRHVWCRPRLLESKVCKRCGLKLAIKRRVAK